MTREQAINYLFSCGFTNEQVGEVVRALTYEPTTKNDLGVDCISRQDVLSEIIRFSTEEGSSVECQQLYCDVNNMPSVTPQLSIPEVTALAEWTEKLTKASEDAYNKGYADGMKAQEPIKGHWIEEFNDLEGEVRFTCSCCGKYQLFGTDFCYHCGAKMVEPQESEEI